MGIKDQYHISIPIKESKDTIIVPNEFIEFAMEFFNRLSGKISFKKKGDLCPECYIREHKSMRYFFEIDLENSPILRREYGSTASRAFYNTICGRFVDGIKSNYKSAEDCEKEKLSALIRSYGMTACRQNRDMAIFSIRISDDGKYVYWAWPVVTKEGNKYTSYGIGLSCEELTERTQIEYGIIPTNINESVFNFLKKKNIDVVTEFTETPDRSKIPTIISINNANAKKHYGKLMSIAHSVASKPEYKELKKCIECDGFKPVEGYSTEYCEKSKKFKYSFIYKLFNTSPYRVYKNVNEELYRDGLKTYVNFIGEMIAAMRCYVNKELPGCTVEYTGDYDRFSIELHIPYDGALVSESVCTDQEILEFNRRMVDKDMIVSAQSLNESLFSKEAPKEFTDLAVKFFSKLSKQLTFKEKGGLDPVEYIKKNKKTHYFFDIDDKDNSLLVASVKAGARGAVFGAIAGPTAGSVAASMYEDPSDKKKEKEARDRLVKAIAGSGCGLKQSANKTPYYKDDFVMLSKDGEYIFKAWAGVGVTGGTYSVYGIGLTAMKAKDNLKKAYRLNESAEDDSAEVFDDDFNEGLSEGASVPDDKPTFNRFFEVPDVEGSLVNMDSSDEKEFYRDPVYNKAIVEYFNICDTKTRRALLSMNEAGQNSVLMSLTSKLYDKIVEKCDDIDYGEIPKTKGDITKLSKYDSMKETISIMHDLLKEYKQDTGPVDELSVALANVESRKDLFERAYRYNSELPIAMYCNVVLGIITGISYMIATCIEFIKDPASNSFRVSLDKISYAKTKEHMIYSTLKSFNKTCANKDFDKAMEAILKSSTKNFAGAAVAGGIAISVIGVILILIPVLRELIFMFYYMRMKVSDFFDIQADLLQMNAYSIQANSTMDKDEQEKIVAKQLKYVDKFRKVSNTFAIDVKKAEVASDKEKKSDDETKMLIDDIDGFETGSNGSALF